MGFKSTIEVANILNVNVSRLSQGVWNGRIPKPQKGPGNSYCWTDADIDKASRVLLGKAYMPEEVVV